MKPGRVSRPGLNKTLMGPQSVRVGDDGVGEQRGEASGWGEHVGCGCGSGLLRWGGGGWRARAVSIVWTSLHMDTAVTSESGKKGDVTMSGRFGFGLPRSQF